MSEWKEIEFWEMLEDESISYGIVQPGFHTEIDSVPIIRVNNIKNGTIRTDEVLKVASTIEEKYKRTRLEGGELLITVVGSVGECAIVPKSLKGWNVARAVSVARIKDGFDKNFIKYAFKTEEIKHQMYGNTNDTVQPTLNLSSLKALKFNIPPLLEQQAIASILNSLDDKIDLLHRQNTTLEEIAETLFRQWFAVEAKEEWEEKTLGSIGNVITGKTPSSQNPNHWGNDVPFVTPTDYKNFGKFVIYTDRYLSIEGKENFKNYLLPPNTILVTCIGSDMGKVVMSKEICVSNQQINSLIINKGFPSVEYVFYYLKSIYSLLRSVAMGGTTMPIINKSDFTNIQITIPSKELLLTFEEVASELSDKIYLNLKQIRTLTALRDTLLPKMISGEVTVSAYAKA